MRTHAQAVVIGGGVIGCSILYHLTKAGWTDVVLLERDELTSGSTWHAAANIHGLHDNNNITRIQNYTMDLYNALEAETGQSCGVFQPGSLYLAQTEAREHQLRLQAAKASSTMAANPRIRTSALSGRSWPRKCRPVFLSSVAL